MTAWDDVETRYRDFAARHPATRDTAAKMLALIGILRREEVLASFVPHTSLMALVLDLSGCPELLSVAWREDEDYAVYLIRRDATQPLDIHEKVIVQGESAAVQTVLAYAAKLRTLTPGSRHD